MDDARPSSRRRHVHDLRERLVNMQACERLTRSKRVHDPLEGREAFGLEASHQRSQPTSHAAQTRPLLSQRRRDRKADMVRNRVGGPDRLFPLEIRTRKRLGECVLELGIRLPERGAKDQSAYIVIQVDPCQTTGAENEADRRALV